MVLPAAMILSGLPQEQFNGDLEVVFNQGTVLLKPPESSPPTSPRSSSPAESGISSLSTDTERSLDYYLVVIDQLEQRFLKHLKSSKSLNHEVHETKIMYQNRNLIDLNDNLKTGSWTLQPAILKKGVKNFFQNRSQMSRLDGAHLPPHEIVKCKCQDCGFDEPFYF